MIRQTSGKTLVLSLSLLLAVAGSAGAGDSAHGAPMDAKAAFEALKQLDGTWAGEAGPAGGEKAPAVSEFEVSAAGSVVMETMMPGTDHEMINMYHLDGDDLLLTHYCAGGNQPTMRLDLAHATATELPFVFTGGTNLDPAKDGHIHSGKMVFAQDGSIESHWSAWYEGKEVATNVFTLRRQ